MDIISKSKERQTPTLSSGVARGSMTEWLLDDQWELKEFKNLKKALSYAKGIDNRFVAKKWINKKFNIPGKFIYGDTVTGIWVYRKRK
jgi:hypothetical protein